jgi:hypothetical protein
VSYGAGILAFTTRDGERGNDLVAYLEGRIESRTRWRRSWVKRRTESDDMTDKFMSRDVADEDVSKIRQWNEKD